MRRFIFSLALALSLFPTTFLIGATDQDAARHLALCEAALMPLGVVHQRTEVLAQEYEHLLEHQTDIVRRNLEKSEIDYLSWEGRFGRLLTPDQAKTYYLNELSKTRWYINKEIIQLNVLKVFSRLKTDPRFSDEIARLRILAAELGVLIQIGDSLMFQKIEEAAQNHVRHFDLNTVMAILEHGILSHAMYPNGDEPSNYEDLRKKRDLIESTNDLLALSFPPIPENPFCCKHSCGLCPYSVGIRLENRTSLPVKLEPAPLPSSLVLYDIRAKLQAEIPGVRFW